MPASQGNRTLKKIEVAEATESKATSFVPRFGVLGASMALVGAYLLSLGRLAALILAGIAFIMGGATPLLRGVWKYLLVFALAAGGFVWLLAHYLK